MHRTIEHSYRGLITFANFVDLMCTLVLPNTKEPYQYNKFIKKAFKVRGCCPTQAGWSADVALGPVRRAELMRRWHACLVAVPCRPSMSTAVTGTTAHSQWRTCGWS